MASQAYFHTAATFDGTDLEGTTDVSASHNGSPTDLITDGNSTVEAVFIDAESLDVTVTLTDLSSLTSFRPGDTGTLTFTFNKRPASGGRGAAASGAITGTCARATLVNIDPSGATTGFGSHTVTFRCAADESNSPVSWATA